MFVTNNKKLLEKKWSFIKAPEAQIIILREEFNMDTLKPQFYILKIAGSLLGHTHTAETKKIE